MVKTFILCESCGSRLMVRDEALSASHFMPLKNSKGHGETETHVRSTAKKNFNRPAIFFASELRAIRPFPIPI